MSGTEILTRRDRETGQPLYDYYLKTLPDANGRFMRALPEGGFYHYELVQVVTARYEVQ